MKNIKNVKFQCSNTVMFADKASAYLLAAAAMTFDHVGLYLFPNCLWFRAVGRLAFPVFAAGIVVGYATTRSFPKYALRMLIAATAAQVFCALLEMQVFNALYTLVCSLIVLFLFDRSRWWGIAGIVCFAAVSRFFDYGLYGLLVVLLFRYAQRMLILPAYITITFLFYGIDVPLLSVAAFLLFRVRLPIRLPRYFFYFYYPAHLAAIWLVHVLVVY